MRLEDDQASLFEHHIVFAEYRTRIGHSFLDRHKGGHLFRWVPGLIERVLRLRDPLRHRQAEPGTERQRTSDTASALRLKKR